MSALDLSIGPKTAVSRPLADFDHIATNTYLFTPDSYTPKEPLILLLSWMGAASKHIAKYTVAHRKLFPTARILLIRNEVVDFFRSEATYDMMLTPALEVIKEHVKAGGEILVHSFSNGGANQLNELAKAWVKREGTPLPMRAQAMDSAPGNGDWQRSHNALAVSLPRFWLWRMLGSAMIHFFIAVLFTMDKLGGYENQIFVIRRQLNNPTLFDKRAPRVYLYSKADEMVGDDEVESHAELSEAQGWKVTRVRFEKSPHAGHVRENEGRYWDAVQAAWKEGASN
ncbi:hypothetical protein BU23DRAFT_262408 [Bimuria novae-zelandiae CBS 107.79]|uniref:Indole-diterpene biosynthesis protein-like protein PaxU n=1 Tax=Bimuria novae-zelandiae CBS 107.79 TaxID=1447943 RepID=A0A6A5UTE0_9PLEO|nr:hypothetical protein BU23DRAFT_262408 [Bimuria novae-zelandiae CBS 107.79]